MEAYAGTDVWVNGTFYNTAFSVKEQNAIVAQNVINEKHPGGSILNGGIWGIIGVKE